MKAKIKGFFGNSLVKVVMLFVRMAIASVLYGASAAVFVAVVLSTIVCGMILGIGDTLIGHDLSDVMMNKALKFLKVKMVKVE